MLKVLATFSLVILASSCTGTMPITVMESCDFLSLAFQLPTRTRAGEHFDRVALKGYRPPDPMGSLTATVDGGGRFFEAISQRKDLYRFTATAFKNRRRRPEGLDLRRATIAIELVDADDLKKPDPIDSFYFSQSSAEVTANGEAHAATVVSRCERDGGR